jgi:5'-nucleotidase
VALNDCSGGLVGSPIHDIVNRTTDNVDLFITGHTHQEYNCVIDDRPVTSAMSLGRVLTDIDLELGRRSRDIESVSVNNEIITRDVAKAPDMTELMTRYQALAEPIGSVPVGRISADILREPTTPNPPGAIGLNPLGNLIADAQLADTAAPDRGDADLALMNPGGVRADLGFAPDGVVTYAEAFAVQPFNNIVTTQTFTGAQLLELLDVLKDQWCSGPRNVLLPSASLTYTYDQSDAAALNNVACGPAVPNPVSNVKINGADLVQDATYRVTTNNFLADGGDSFASLRLGTNRHTQDDFDIDSLVRYLEPSLTGTPIAPPAANRSITIVP